jgi:cytochrome b pre-mRNA-processing protein 3
MPSSREASSAAGSGVEAAGETPPRGYLALMALAVAVLGSVAFWAWSEGDERRALGRLPEAERRALYVRTLQSLEQLCTAPREGLRGYCQSQADFLAEFPECDSECYALVAAQHPPQRPR